MVTEFEVHKGTNVKYVKYETGRYVSGKSGGT